MANEIRVGIGEEGSLAHCCAEPARRSVIPPVLKLPVDLGHVTGLVAARCDWVFRHRLDRSGFSPQVGGVAALGPARRST